jgi:hypothetical protein
VAAEVAVELGSESHLARNLHPDNGKDRSFVPIPSIGQNGFRISGYGSAGEVVARSARFLRRSLAGLDVEGDERRARLA